jgi:predicted PurR-regulated permease PerM
MAQRPGLRGRLRLNREEGRKPGAQEELLLTVEPAEMTGIFAAPSWLRDLGVMSWLLVGVAVLVVALVALLAATNTIVIPVITATIIAAVLAPVVRKLANHMPRGAAAGLVFLALLLVGGAIAYGVVAGVTSHASELQSELQKAVGKLQNTLQDAGVSADKAKSAGQNTSASVSDAFDTLKNGVAKGVSALAGIAIFLSFTALSLFFLLKDGPSIRRWGERHMGLPDAVSQTITHRTLGALRGYFAGVTAVAAFNAIVIGAGALILGVPNVGAIALVNFLAAYIPYLGAWSAGAFTVLVALGSQGTTDAVIMAVIVLLANGALQQMIQPIAFGATLGIHPLAVLIVTIAGGALFGTIGLVIAAPLTSAAVHVSEDLARARALEERETGTGAGPEPAPA